MFDFVVQNLHISIRAFFLKFLANANVLVEIRYIWSSYLDMYNQCTG